MKNRFNNLKIVLLGAVLLLSGCNKELSAPPKNAKVDVNTITDQASAQVALNGAYYRLANINELNHATQVGHHQFPGSIHTGYMSYGYGENPGDNNDMAAASYSDQVWINAYQLINAANGVINGVEKLNPTLFFENRRAEILGEAKFLRAYGHFQVLCNFAQWFDIGSTFGVLLRKELSTLGNIPIPRSNVKDSYDFILSDLDEAILYCKSDNPRYYATKYTAMALKIRVLMCRGGVSDYATVIDLADAIIAAGPYDLEDNLQDLFYSRALASPEVLLGIKAQANQHLFADNNSNLFYPGASGLWGATTRFYQIFEDDDPRKEWMFGDLLTDNIPFATPGLRYLSKYFPFGTAATEISETGYLFRLSEVYLMKSEAILRSEGSLSEARDIIQEVMRKSGVSNFSTLQNANSHETLLLQNFYEVSRNLIAEDGIEWLAFLRLPFAKVQELRPTITHTIQFIYPIPASELRRNPVFGPQNPGYSNW